MIQVLIDADNISAPRIRALLRALPDDVRITVAGSDAAVAAVRWPARAAVTEISGWQQADVVLVSAYQRNREPLVLVTETLEVTEQPEQPYVF